MTTLGSSARAGIVGTLMIAAIILLSYRFDQLPIISSGRTMTAEFAEVGGLQSGDDVTISGATVGKVESMKIVDGIARVKFKLNTGMTLGSATKARIVTQTLLGAAALEVDPGKGRAVKDGSIIPVSQTTSPYDVTQALSQLTNTTTAIDKDQLSNALGQVSSTFNDTPEDLRGAIRGLSRVANTINDNDDALLGVLKSARDVSGTLAKRNEQVSTLLTSGNSLLTQLNERDKVIVALLHDAQNLAKQLDGLVKENRKVLKPALQQLNHVVDQLNANKTNLEQTIEGVSSYATELGEAVTTGTFFDAYVQNLTSLQTVAPVLSGLVP